MLVDLIRANAKAIAVPITALVLWVAAKLADNAGVDLNMDNDTVTNVVVAAIVTVTVWLTRNRPKPAPE